MNFNKKIFVILLFAICIVSLLFGSVAYYRFLVSGNINGSTGNAVFNVTGFKDDSSSIKTIELGKVSLGDSGEQKKKVYAYLVDSGLKDGTDSTKPLYNLYIVSEAPVFAPVSCKYFFAEFQKLTIIKFNNNFNTSKVTDMGSMFYNCKSLAELDFSDFNTSNVTNMYNMFYSCSSLTNLNLSNFNTLNLTNMGQLFSNCLSLKDLDLSSFNTSNVTSMSSMFYECKVLTDLDLSSFNTSKVKDMRSMFYFCSKLTTTINIMNENITSYEYMFNGAATANGAKITVNYIAALDTIAEGETQSLIDKIIATKSPNSNIVKGSQI